MAVHFFVGIWDFQIFIDRTWLILLLYNNLYKNTQQINIIYPIYVCKIHNKSILFTQSMCVRYTANQYYLPSVCVCV